VLAALGTRSWFSPEMMATAKWLSRYYMCSLAEAMRLFIPGKSSIKRHPVYENGKLVAYEIEERLKAKKCFGLYNYRRRENRPSKW
jgi:primosomal protein N' (replication factor Y)